MITHVDSLDVAGGRTKCVVVGHATIDDIIFERRDSVRVLGGAAAYAACGAAQAGGAVSLVTVTGTDYDFGGLERSVAERTTGTLDLSGCRVASGATIRNRCWYRGAEERDWEVVDWQSMARMSPDWSDLARLAPSPGALVICPTLVSIAGDVASRGLRRYGSVIIDTEVHYLSGPESAQHLLEPARGGALLLPSWAHLPGLFSVAASSEDDVLVGNVAKRCTEEGIDRLVVKHGESGSVILDNQAGCCTVIPAAASSRMTDPTGAGDVFDGAFAVTFARTGDAIEAACWASMAASFAVEHRGATVAPHFGRSEAVRRLRSIRSGVSRSVVSKSRFPRIP